MNTKYQPSFLLPLKYYKYEKLRFLSLILSKVINLIKNALKLLYWNSGNWRGSLCIDSKDNFLSVLHWSCDGLSHNTNLMKCEIK